MEHLFRADLLCFVGCVAFFVAVPNADVWVSQQFFTPDLGFTYSKHPIVMLSYEVFAQMHFGVIAVLLAYLAWTYLSGPRQDALVHQFNRRLAVFLLAVLFVGPGLIVNGVWKEHWGRARPFETQNFGGEHQYTPPMQPAQECDTNCSFVSGHAAMGFYWLSLAWVLNRRYWLLVGLVLGSFVGLGRILQGNHFLSDIVFSFWTVYFSACVIATCFSLRFQKKEVS
jgi:lipid A 4'-phosphatase